jgi:hypothetical protein
MCQSNETTSGMWIVFATANGLVVWALRSHLKDSVCVGEFCGRNEPSVRELNIKCLENTQNKINTVMKIMCRGLPLMCVCGVHYVN